MQNKNKKPPKARSPRKGRSPRPKAETVVIPKRYRGRVSCLERMSRSKYSKMLTAIRTGTYAWVAANIAGLSPKTFLNYMRRGRDCVRTKTVDGKEKRVIRKRDKIYRTLFLDVVRAYCEARGGAEKQVYVHSPLTWLRQTARSTANGMMPGWDAGESNKLVVESAQHQPVGAIGVGGESEPMLEESGQDLSTLLPQKSVVVGALVELERLGFIQRTAQGMELLGGMPVAPVTAGTSSVIDIESNGHNNGQPIPLDEDDDDDDD